MNIFPSSFIAQVVTGESAAFERKTQTLLMQDGCLFLTEKHDEFPLVLIAIQIDETHGE